MWDLYYELPIVNNNEGYSKVKKNFDLNNGITSKTVLDKNSIVSHLKSKYLNIKIEK
jgi:hypothetical protein